MEILTWNINFRGASALDPLNATRARPDIVTLQEVRLGQSEAVHERLHDMGYESVYSGHPNAAEKQYGNVIAARVLPPLVREKVWASMRRAVRPQGRLIALDFAVPRPASLLGRIARSLAEQDERSLITIHREHYENFQEFMRGGGLRTWIQERSESVETEYDFWGGAIAVVICRRSDSS